MDQFDLFNSSHAKSDRDAALELVTANENEEWMADAYIGIANLPRDWEGTGEDIRYLLTPRLGQPHHHNVWGALIHHAVKDQLLLWTGSMTSMRGPRSHARITKVYRRFY